MKNKKALDTACPSVKKQVVELLSALCVYSQDGRQRAIDTLHIYQVGRVCLVQHWTYGPIGMERQPTDLCFYYC